MKKLAALLEDMGLDKYKDPDYVEWEGDVIDAVDALIDVGHSDATGIVWGQKKVLADCWRKKLSPKEAAKKIDISSRA